MSDATTQFILAAILVPIGGLFAAVDAALNTLSHARVEGLIGERRAGATRLAKVLAERARYVNLLVLLRVSSEIGATVLLAGGLISLDVMSLGLALLTTCALMVVIDFVVIGVGPRTLGRQHAYSLSLMSAIVLQFIGTLLGPVSRLLVLLGNAVTPGRGFPHGPFATEIELREVVDLAKESGVVADDERRMIQSVFELGDTPARGVMVPRTEMVWIESVRPAVDALKLAVKSGYSRIPVIGEDADDILGVAYLKDIVRVTTLGGNGEGTVADIMRPAVFVPDSKPLDDLLEEMQRDRNHMALLVDEYGGIAGLVTIEDILEEIVGEIADEYDLDEKPPIVALPDNVFRVSARLSIEDLGELFGCTIEEGDIETVGGLLAHELGRVPLPGARVVRDGLELIGEGDRDARGRMRLHSVVVRQLEPQSQEEA